MATKKSSKKPASAPTSNEPLFRQKKEERAKTIATKYPAIVKALEAVGEAFEVVTPAEARSVSGFVRSQVATFCEERRAEAEQFRKEQRLKTLEEREARSEKWRSELAELRASMS